VLPPPFDPPVVLAEPPWPLDDPMWLIHLVVLGELPLPPEAPNVVDPPLPPEAPNTCKVPEETIAEMTC